MQRKKPAGPQARKSYDEQAGDAGRGEGSEALPPRGHTPLPGASQEGLPRAEAGSAPGASQEGLPCVASGSSVSCRWKFRLASRWGHHLRGGLPWGVGVVKTPPDGSGVAGSLPGPGRSQLVRHHGWVCLLQPAGRDAWARGLHLPKPQHPRESALQAEKPLQSEARVPCLESSPRSPQLGKREKVCAQQRRLREGVK